MTESAVSQEIRDRTASLQQAVKDPDAAEAKKMLPRIEHVARRIAAARANLRSLLGEGRDMAPPAKGAPGPRGMRTGLQRTFFDEADLYLDALERDIKVLEEQIAELGPKLG